MSGYRLIFKSKLDEEGEAIEAPTASGALALAQRYSHGRPVEVWSGDHMVCRIAEAGRGGFWELS